MDVFDLFAKISLDSSEYDKGIEGAGGKLKAFGSSMASGLKTVASVGMAAVGAASTAVTAMVKSSVDGYAEYEQLVGGIETMFEDLSWDVQQNANNAFKTAGMSANEYMETVMGFSASLNQSLLKNEGNIARAADLSDQIITDMADNSNKMGTSMESIQNAYAGFAKQNYTMLDNLKLGYGGTKEEMERLLRDAEKMAGLKVGTFDVSNFADIAEAIHIVQEDMGIMGTTALEASATISGSLASMKSAWQNLVVGMADGEADLELLIGNVVDSAETVLGNIMPVAEKALDGVINLIEKSIPIFVDRIPNLIEEVLPKLLDSGAKMVQVITKGISQNANKFVSMAIKIAKDILPTILKAGGDIVFSLLQGISDNIDELLNGALEIISSIGSFLMDNTEKLLDAAVSIIEGLADFLVQNLPTMIPAVVDIILTIVEKLTDPEMIMKLLDAALAIILALADGIINALPKLIEKAPVIVQNLVDGIIKAVPKLADAAGKLIEKLWEGIKDHFGDLLDAGVDIVMKLIEGVASWLAELVKTGADIGNSIKEGFWEFVEAATQWGKDLIDNFIKGLLAKWEDLKKTVADLAGSIADYLGFSEPKKGPLSNFHTFAPDMMDLFAQGIEDNKKKITSAIQDSFDLEPAIQASYSSSVDGATGTNSNLVSALITALRAVAPEFATNIRIDGNKDRIVDIVVEENERSIIASGRGLLEA